MKIKGKYKNEKKKKQTRTGGTKIKMCKGVSKRQFEKAR